MLRAKVKIPDPQRPDFWRVANEVKGTVWIQVPYAAGKGNDMAIFNNCLVHFLDPNELVEADCGYHGHEDQVKCPNNPYNPVENVAMQAWCVEAIMMGAEHERMT